MSFEDWSANRELLDSVNRVTDDEKISQEELLTLQEMLSSSKEWVMWETSGEIKKLTYEHLENELITYIRRLDLDWKFYLDSNTIQVDDGWIYDTDVLSGWYISQLLTLRNTVYCENTSLQDFWVMLVDKLGNEFRVSKDLWKVVGTLHETDRFEDITDEKLDTLIFAYGLKPNSVLWNEIYDGLYRRGRISDLIEATSNEKYWWVDSKIEALLFTLSVSDKSNMKGYFEAQLGDFKPEEVDGIIDEYNWKRSRIATLAEIYAYEWDTEKALRYFRTIASSPERDKGYVQTVLDSPEYVTNEEAISVYTHQIYDSVAAAENFYNKLSDEQKTAVDESGLWDFLVFREYFEVSLWQDFVRSMWIPGNDIEDNMRAFVSTASSENTEVLEQAREAIQALKNGKFDYLVARLTRTLDFKEINIWVEQLEDSSSVIALLQEYRVRYPAKIWEQEYRRYTRIIDSIANFWEYTQAAEELWGYVQDLIDNPNSATTHTNVFFRAKRQLETIQRKAKENGDNGNTLADVNWTISQYSQGVKEKLEIE